MNATAWILLGGATSVVLSLLLAFGCVFTRERAVPDLHRAHQRNERHDHDRPTL